MNFEKSCYFFRFVLAGATEAQLKYLQITPREREALLAKDFAIVQQNSDTHMASFSYGSSYRQNKTIISYDKTAFGSEALECAAHEQVHAACFWARPNWHRNIMMRSVDMMMLGTMVAVAGGVAGSGKVAAFGLAASAIGYSPHYIGNKKEEMRAYRVGYLFSPRLYLNRAAEEYSDEERKFDKENKWRHLLRNYPTIKRCHALYDGLVAELNENGGNILFPDGITDYRKMQVAFEDRKPS